MKEIGQIVLGAIIIFGGIVGLSISFSLDETIRGYVGLGTGIAIIVGLLILVPAAKKRIKNS